ncbi:undecaprenyldiphospho-muramoylpentapeptide beta-N-acetylglucosaminyltransferase [Pleionea sp. CnH1-48]|uniref:undecaprenyldiphospho-muramoylpentapeptide beta-N-acetylglucosaminyltransferase n=1 Tax=Pleionea sp. CnH1-48 TaxID=2954494 RepID=UPI002096EFFC|nr:undecaprenyldiphospho-muramoylpentapeptide beta-N-acetylglucosaminyltransferase [Pleionea sp. CnH1-48]
MSTSSTKNILVMAGGTGGHIFPGLAVAHALIEKGYSIHWLGSVGGMEQELVSDDNITLHLLPIKGLRGKGMLELIKAPFRLISAISKALAIVRKTQPQLVIGFGGFASGPGGFAAGIARKPLIIHEQNATAGLTNRILARWANTVCEAFAGAFKATQATQATGNPLRKNIIDWVKNSEAKTVTKPLSLLIVGGSRGAKIFNDELPKLLVEWIQNNDIRVVHQTGKGNFESVSQQYGDEVQSKKLVTVTEFIHDMDQAYSDCDFVICRAGALTVSEVAAMGKPAIFVPYPWAVDDHQTMNARFLSDKGAAFLVPQSDISEISKHIQSLVEQPTTLDSMAKMAQQQAELEATDNIVAICEEVIGSKAA